MKSMDLPMFALITATCLSFLTFAYWYSGFTPLFSQM